MCWPRVTMSHCPPPKEISTRYYALVAEKQVQARTRTMVSKGRGGMSSWFLLRNFLSNQVQKIPKPRYSMYGLFTYIWVVSGVNVGMYTIL